MKKVLLSFITILLLIPGIAQQNNSNNNNTSAARSGCSGGSFGPWILTEPQTQSICPGATVSFVAKGGLVQNIHFWEMSTDGGLTWSASIGQHTFSYSDNTSWDTLTIPVIFPEMSGYRFRCYYGGYCKGAYSTAAALIVSPGPTQIISQPANYNACLNESAVFDIALQGGSFSYQWQQSTNGGTSFQNIPGKTAALLQVDSVNLMMNNYRYRCIISSACSNTVTSEAAILVVNSDTTVITQQPQHMMVCVDDTARFSTAASGNNLQYQWQVQLPDFTYADIPGATSNEFTTTDIAGKWYRCKIMSSCSSLFTNVVNASYQGTPLFYPARVMFGCEGESLQIFAFSNTITATYQWMQSADSGVTYQNIPGQTSDFLSQAVTAAKHGYRYKCLVSNSCFTGYSDVVTVYSLNVSPLSVLSQTHTQTTCAGVATRIYADAGTATANCRWQISNDNGVTYTDLPAFNDGVSHFNTNWPQMGILQNTPGTYFYRCRVIGGCTPDIYSGPVTLVVSSNPAIAADTSLYVSCDSCKTNILSAFDLSPADSFTFNRVELNTATSNQADPSLAGLGRYSLKVFSAAGCPGSSNIHVNIKKTDTLKICAFDRATLVSSIAGSSYQWQINRGFGNGFENVTDNTAGISYSLVNGALTNTLNIYEIRSPLLVRCKVNGSAYSNTYVISMPDFWTGAVSTAWEDPRNWSCGTPNYFSDVVIPRNLARYPVINSPKQYCRTLVTEPGTEVKIKSGMELIVDEYFQY